MAVVTAEYPETQLLLFSVPRCKSGRWRCPSCHKYKSHRVFIVHGSPCTECLAAHAPARPLPRRVERRERFASPLSEEQRRTLALKMIASRGLRFVNDAAREECIRAFMSDGGKG